VAQNKGARQAARAQAQRQAQRQVQRPAQRQAQRPAPQQAQRQAQRQTQRSAAPAAPQYTGALAQYAAPEGFGAGAYMRAQAAGLTDAEIRAGVENLRQQGMKIGERVNIATNPQTYGNEMAQRGAAEGGFSDAGSGLTYGMRPVFLPEGSTVGGGKGVVWASGPMTNQQILNMFAGKPRESYVLPASTQAPDLGYRAPAGTPYVDVSASPSAQSMQAVAGLDIPQLPIPPATARRNRAMRFAKARRQPARLNNLIDSRINDYLASLGSLATKGAY
jgi:hypothetical protein